MTRATPIILSAALMLGTLAGCGSRAPTPPVASNTAAPAEDDEIEALPSDGLAAPEGMAIDSESGTDTAGGSATGNASGGNTM